jgi:hypothetical protein
MYIMKEFAGFFFLVRVVVGGVQLCPLVTAANLHVGFVVDKTARGQVFS